MHVLIRYIFMFFYKNYNILTWRQHLTLKFLISFGVWNPEGSMFVYFYGCGMLKTLHSQLGEPETFFFQTQTLAFAFLRFSFQNFPSSILNLWCSYYMDGVECGTAWAWVAHSHTCHALAREPRTFPKYSLCGQLQRDGRPRSCVLDACSHTPLLWDSVHMFR